MKVYCKNCMHYSHLGSFRAIARCKAKNIRNDWDSQRWIRKYCSLKNADNDCEDYERRGTRTVNKEE